MSTLNGFRWFMSVTAPLIVVVLIFSLMVDMEDEFFLKVELSNFYLYLFIHGVEMFITFMICVVMSCLVAPRPKKKAALIITGIIITLLFMLLYFGFNESTLSLTTLVAFIGVFFGLAIGAVISRILFKNKGWNAIKEVEREPAEQY